MSSSDRRNSKLNMWLVIGVVVLIILLLVWLTIADFWGATDVAAWIAPWSPSSLMFNLLN